VIERQLDEMAGQDAATLVRARYDRFRQIGVFGTD
jgi:acetyl-CoA carboxylase alpha subunit